jgi:hypothetical protein
MRPARLALACVVVAVAAIAGGARADDALDLSWTAPPACPGRDAVLAEVRRLLGGRSGKGGRLAVDALVTAADGGYRLRITTRGDGGERARMLAAPTCGELADAAALIIALGLDPQAVAASGTAAPPGSARPDPSSAPASAPSGTGPTPAPPAPSPPGAPAPPSGATGPVATTASSGATGPLGAARASGAARPPDAAAAKAASARGWMLSVYAGGAGDAGTFRDATAIARGGVSVARGGLRLEVIGLFAWAGRVTVAGDPAKGGEPWLAGAALSVGGDGTPDGRGATRSALRLTGAAGLELGVQGASGFGVASPGHGEAPWVAPFGTAIARWAIVGPLRLRLDVAVLVPLVRPEFVLTNVGLVHQAGPVAGRLSAGIEIDAFLF